MPITEDQIETVEQWVKEIWDNYADRVLALTSSNPADIDLGEFKAQRELLVEARAALAEVRNLSHQS